MGAAGGRIPALGRQACGADSGFRFRGDTRPTSGVVIDAGEHTVKAPGPSSRRWNFGLGSPDLWSLRRAWGAWPLGISRNGIADLPSVSGIGKIWPPMISR